jgi:GAF domain-containing protein
LLHQAQQQLQTIFIGDIDANHPLSTSAPWVKHHSKTVLLLPFVSRSKLIALLYLEHHLRPHAFNADQIVLLELIATHTVLALENARLRHHI